MRKFLQDENKTIVMHNGIRWDQVHLERLLGIKITARIVDSLGLSWTLFPKRPSHGLEDWGESFGIPKPKIDDWHNLSLEEYTHRCEEDVKINYRLWLYIWNKLLALYGQENEEDIWRYVEYINHKLYQAQLQEKFRWKLDIDFCEKALIELTNKQKEKVDILRKVMPKVPIKKKKTLPKKMYKKDGSLSSHGLTWFELIERSNLPPDSPEIEYIDGYEEPNPGSHDQIKNWLYSLGWKPETHKQVKNKETGEIREVPQINKEKQKGGGICNSVKKLYEKEPLLEHLDGLSILNHRISILEGFLRDVDAEGYLKARISGFTNTLRVRHTEIVNLPKPNVEYGKLIRGSLVAPEGFELCGADMSSLEDRLKQHYIYPLDPEYVKEMSRDDWDPHLDIAQLGGRMTKQEVEAYKDGDTSKKFIRDIMKNVNYALIRRI